ncbi:unnamed protein product [Diamesa serratosioi]
MNSKLNKVFLNTSLGGFRFLATTEKDKKKPIWRIWISKIFWVIFIGISCWSMYYLLLQNANDYNEQAASINLNTNYKDWNNTFPAISVCVTKGRSTNKIKEFLEEHWNSANQEIPTGIRYYKIILSYLFLNPYQPLDGINLASCSVYNETCGIDLDVMKRYLLPQSCKDFMQDLTYFNKQYDNCESIFKYYKTEIGDCFTANSIYSNDGKHLDSFNSLPLKYMNSDQLDRVLKFKYSDLQLVALKLFIHSPEEFPDGNSNSYVLRKSDAQTFLGLKTTEIENQPDVKFEPKERRQCQFPYEYLGSNKVPYSITNCFSYQRMQRELLNCNCTLPIGNVPKNSTICNINQFQCVKDLVYNEDQELETCSLPSCIAMQIEEISHIDTDVLNSMGSLTVEVMNKPTLRFVRRVVETKLDIIVEFGGIVGLFLGASILSLLELIFLFVDFKHNNSN